MNHYYFLLGSTPELSLRELRAVIGADKVSEFNSKFAQVELDTDADASRVFLALGGSLKVLKDEGKFADVSEEKLLEYIIAYFAQYQKLDFAVAEFGREQIQKISLSDVKKGLRNRGVSSRFIEGPRDGLSASVLLHQDVTELNIIQTDKEVIFAKTLEVQDIDDWTKRDREKPYADRKKGMLPPKVARMMVNIALGQYQENASGEGSITVYDPFCGTGTVLIEALMRGCAVVGSDLDKDAVQGATENIEWFMEEYRIEKDFAVFYADASSVSLKNLDKPVDIIVTEPFLGKQTPQEQQLPGIFKGIEKLYHGAFKQWAKILQPNGVVAIVFPYAKPAKTVFSLEGLIDKLRQLGYTPMSEPVMYHRPDATIQRQIWVFQLSKGESKQ